jgi:8-oxo-dGTP pyrophosphatase MutT (NUDIX family)
VGGEGERALMLKPWPTVRKKQLGDYRIFSLRSEEKLSPRTNLPHEFFILDCVNWVNVIAVTADNQLVMVEQFRHGSNTVELEIPGGTTDASDGSPIATGVRELQEETGYAGENPQLIGQVFSNPAILSNTTYTVLVQDCRLQHEVQLDSGEDLITRLVPIADIPDLVRNAKIRHSLVVVALYHFDLWQRRGPESK